MNEPEVSRSNATRRVLPLPRRPRPTSSSSSSHLEKHHLHLLRTVCQLVQHSTPHSQNCQRSPSPIMDPTPPPASTSSTSTFLSSHYLSTIPPDSINDLQSFLDDQRRAEQEAREAMPFQTGECSWERGYVKQSVWACRGESAWGSIQVVWGPGGEG